MQQHHCKPGLVHDDLVLVQLAASLGKHVIVDRVEKRLDKAGDALKRQCALGAVVTANSDNLLLGQIAGADLNAQWHACRRYNKLDGSASGATHP